jgi:hypothetical protein
LVIIDWPFICICEGFFVAMIVLVEIYLRLEDRLLTAGNKSFTVTDDVPAGSLISNLTRVFLNCIRRFIFHVMKLKFEICNIRSRICA